MVEKNVPSNRERRMNPKIHEIWLNYEAIEYSCERGELSIDEAKKMNLVLAAKEQRLDSANFN